MQTPTARGDQEAGIGVAGVVRDQHDGAARGQAAGPGAAVPDAGEKAHQRLLEAVEEGESGRSGGCYRSVFENGNEGGHGSDLTPRPPSLRGKGARFQESNAALTVRR